MKSPDSLSLDGSVGADVPEIITSTPVSIKLGALSPTDSQPGLTNKEANLLWSVVKNGSAKGAAQEEYKSAGYIENVLGGIYAKYDLNHVPGSSKVLPVFLRAMLNGDPELAIKIRGSEFLSIDQGKFENLPSTTKMIALRLGSHAIRNGWGSPVAMRKDGSIKQSEYRIFLRETKENDLTPQRAAIAAFLKYTDIGDRPTNNAIR
jgi:hypothetical protein